MDDFDCYRGLKTGFDCDSICMLCPPVSHVCCHERSLRPCHWFMTLPMGASPKNDPGKIWVLWETPEVRSAAKDKVLLLLWRSRSKRRRRAFTLHKNSTDQGLYQQTIILIWSSTSSVFWKTVMVWVGPTFFLVCGARNGSRWLFSTTV